MSIHILSPETLGALSAEYLQGSDVRGRENAHALANHLSDLVTFVMGGAELSYCGIRWIPVDNSEPYSTFEDMSEAIHRFPTTGVPIEVSDCYHDHPIFSRYDNLRFRVWHDTHHWLRNLGFDRNSELQLFKAQAYELNDRTLIDALFSESVYQLAAAVTLGTFPDEQFVRSPGPVGRAVLDAWGF